MSKAYWQNQYVYYDVMPEDAVDYHRPYLDSLYKEAVDNLRSVNFIQNGDLTGADAILSMAQAEATKEIQFLNEIFGANLNIDPTKMQTEEIRSLNEAMNTAFRFKQIMERNAAIIKAGAYKSNSKGVFSWYLSYLKKALKRHFYSESNGMLNEIKKLMLANKNMEAGEAAKIVFDRHMPGILSLSIREMLKEADVELKGMDPEYINAYKEMYEFINNELLSKKNNIFLQRLTEIYGLNEISNSFAQTLNEIQGTHTRFSKARTTKAFNKLKNKDLEKLGTGETKWVKGGYTLEALVDQAIAMLASGLYTSNESLHIQPNVKVHTSPGFGRLDSRADNVAVFNADVSRLTDAIQDIQADGFERTRLKDVEHINELTRRVTEIDKGYIVYFNDKNYGVGNNRGHKAAEKVNLETLQGMLGGLVDNVDQLIYNLLQSGADAIDSKSVEESSLNAVAQAVAYFLFDDYKTIGTVGTNGQSIHIMALEGMLVPLSTYLFAMGYAMQNLGRHVKSWSKATISAPNILYPKGSKPKGQRFISDSWDEQRNKAMSETTLQITFLISMQTMVRQYF